jgi:uncharacterized protein (DUF427 family)
VEVRFGGQTVADSRKALRVLETAGPPCYYVPVGDVRMDLLTPVDRTTVCEWKGTASYFDIVVDGRTAGRAAWTYPEPTEPFGALRDHIAFYPGRVDACLLDGERVRPQPGEYYGGWVTDDVVGPFKGEPGSEDW